MPLSLNKLNKMYTDADGSLNSHFAEIRSNILLDTGFHHPRYDRYGNNRSPMWRDKGNRSSVIRITKNHIQYITKYIRNSIQNRAPGGQILPRNRRELKDNKSAQLNSSVWEWHKEVSEFDQFLSDCIHSFVVSGELYAKVFWDPNQGPVIGTVIKEEFDEETGEVSIVEIPLREGRLVNEVIPAYNMLTDPDANCLREVKWHMIRKHLAREELEDRYKGDERKLEIIRKSGGQDYKWFNGVTGIYNDMKDSVQIRETYIKPNNDYPNGYFYISTDAGILEDGELPDGYPIFTSVFDESPSNPRGYSMIKQARPFQAEINRCAAAVITESIVLGHSTVIYQAGSKLSTSSIGNGLKGLQYSSAKPDVIPGRSGEQYIDYMLQQISEMYRICNVPEINQDKQKSASNNDAQAMLFRSMRDKLRFSLYAEKIEKFIIKIMGYSLDTLRMRLPDQVLIPVVGKDEGVNIPEFKNTTPQSYQISIKPRTDDFTSMMGKSLQLQQVMQYMGSQLSPDQMASLARELPFLDDTSAFNDLAIYKDQADSVILGLDRGEDPFFFSQSNHAYMIQRLTKRMNENDFPTLNPEIQIRYQERIDMHAQFEAQQNKEAQLATSGYIPTSGGLTKCDVYITKEDGKQERLVVPTDALEWLQDKLIQQGTNVERLQNLDPYGQAQVGQQVAQQMGPSQDPSNVIPMEGFV